MFPGLDVNNRSNIFFVDEAYNRSYAHCMNEHILRAVEISGGQAKLAEACHVTQAAVSKWARGESVISAENALRVERATGGMVTAHDLRPDVEWVSVGPHG